LQYPRAMCDYNVWCYCPSNIQKCSYLAPWSLSVSKWSPWYLFFTHCLLIQHHDPYIALWTLPFWNWFSGSVKTSQLFFAVTRLMWRTGKWRQSRLLSTGRRICSTMRFQLRATITLRSHSCTLPGSLQGRCHFSSFYIVRNNTLNFIMHFN